MSVLDQTGSQRGASLQDEIFLHLEMERAFGDPEGVDFPNDATALIEAAKHRSRAVCEHQSHAYKWRVVVKNADGIRVGWVPLDPALAVHRRRSCSAPVNSLTGDHARKRRRCPPHQAQQAPHTLNTCGSAHSVEDGPSRTKVIRPPASRQVGFWRMTLPADLLHPVTRRSDSYMHWNPTEPSRSRLKISRGPNADWRIAL